MKRRAGLETHPLYSVGACREAGDIQAELLEVGLAGPRDFRGDAEMVIPPAPPGDDIGWFVALTEAGLRHSQAPLFLSSHTFGSATPFTTQPNCVAAPSATTPRSASG